MKKSLSAAALSSKNVKKSKLIAATTRFIIMHAGSETGFIKGAEFHFLCKKHTIDPLFEIEPEKYEKWFQENLLPNLPKECVIVLDNTSYHTRPIETDDSKLKSTNEEKVKKASKNDKISKSSNKNSKTSNQDDELNKSTTTNNSKQPKYRIDELAEKSGRIILRIPPYHSELNLMEFVWNKVRHIMAENKCTILGAYEKITSEDWRDFINQVKKSELEMWITDDIKEDMNYKNYVKKVISMQSSYNEDYPMINEAGTSKEFWENFKSEK